VIARTSAASVRHRPPGQAIHECNAAIGESFSVAVGGDRVAVSSFVTAADSGRAAALAMTVARYAFSEDDAWDLAGAPVSARPA
jgi:hypothetical protein